MSLVASLFRSGNPEDPRTSFDDLDLDGGGRALSGVCVTRRRAMGHSPVYRAVTMLSGDIAKIPAFVYRRTSDGGKVRDPNHPAFKLLRRQANSEMKSFDWKRTTAGHALITHGGYSYIDHDGRGLPVALIPLDPDRTIPVRENGRLWYVYTTPSGEMRKLDPSEVFHLKGLSYDGLVGYSPLELMRESLGLGLALRDHASLFFGNGARPGVVLEHPGKIGEDAQKRLRESWNSMQGGLSNSHKVAILEEGLKLNAFSATMEDSQAIEARKFDVREVANFFGVPPHMLGDDSRTSHSSLEQESMSYLTGALDQWLCAFEEEAEAKLLSTQEREADSHIVEFNRSAVVRADLAARSAYYNKALAGAGWMTANEVRGIENLNPLDGDDANTLIVPLNLRDPNATAQRGAPTSAATTSHAADGAGPATGAAGDVSAVLRHAERAMADTAGRMARRLANEINSATKDHRTFPEALERLERRHGQVVREALTPVVDLVCAALGVDEAAAVARREEALRALFETMCGRADAVTDEATAAQLPAAVSEAMRAAEAEAAARCVEIILGRVAPAAAGDAGGSES